MGKIWPFLVLNKLDRIIEQNNVVDGESEWRPRLTTPAARQAALRIEDRETARVERLEDKLGRQQPVAALLVPVATALLVTAWVRGYAVIVFTAMGALVAAGLVLWTGARANVPFHHHALTVPELEDIVARAGDSDVEVAARAVTDSQRNIPRGISIQNRIDAVRHALLTALALIVLSGLSFAVPNWNSAEVDTREHVTITRRLEAAERHIALMETTLARSKQVGRRLRHDVARIDHLVRRIAENLRH